MSATILLVAFAFGQSQPEKAVTDAEKKEFLKLLPTLPTVREFFAKQAYTKAAPYTRVLLALTEKDLEKHDIYPFWLLSYGLMDLKEARRYATASFDKIAHPQIKLACAIGLFRQGQPPAAVVAFLRKAVDSEEEGNFGLGPGFQDFKDEVIRAYEAGKRMKVELVKQHSIQAFPKYGGGFDYTNSTYVFGPDRQVYAVRPHQEKQRGELVTYDLAGGKASRRLVPQPAGFKPQYNFLHYFGDAVLSVNSGGDLLCRWTIAGNGDHGIALLKKGSDAFVVNRVALTLAYGSLAVPRPEGAWYVIQTETGGFFNVYHLDQDLQFTLLGKIRRRQSSSVLGACFLSKDVLHLFLSSEENSHGGLRCIDFDVKERKLLHNRALLRLDPFVWPYRGTVLQFNDGALHYCWGIEDQRDVTDPKGKKRERLTGIYYQAEAESAPVKAGGGSHHRAVAVGDRIVVCYAVENAPNQVFFRVIRHGTIGPVTELTVAKGREHELWADYMALHTEGDRIWFVNTLAPNTLYELRLVDTKSHSQKP